jgi:hypothetical protein
MRSRSILTFVTLVTLVIGCSSAPSAPTIDPSTPESTEKSIQAVQAALPEAERDRFSTALSVVIANALGGGYRDVGDTPEGRARVREALAGKSAQQIIADAERIQQEQASGAKKAS